MNPSRASLESQLKGAPCPVEDTEEIFWLRQGDDYQSRVLLGDKLCGQYRFRQALEAYRAAARIRDDQPDLFVRLGGAHLTLFHFPEAKAAYDRSAALGAGAKALSYPLGVWHYLQGRYHEAAAYFAAVLPCGDEMRIAALYWHALSCLRGHLPDPLLDSYHPTMQVGHHEAYRATVEVFLGLQDAGALAKEAEGMGDLDAVVALYGLCVHLEATGRTGFPALRAALLARAAAWPCISYLAAWNDAAQ